jgi:hypothetical protein
MLHHPLRTVGTICVTLFVIAGGGFVWFRYFAFPARPVNVNQVIGAYTRDAARRGGDEVRDGQPAPGVYLERTSGNESIDALGGRTNDYPSRTALTVTPTSCGVTTQWDVLQGRSTRTELCHAADGTWSVVGQQVSDRFFDTTEVVDYTCRGPDLPATVAVGDRWSVRCTDGKSRLTRSYEAVGTERITVGKRAVDVIRLHIRIELRGRRNGAGTEERWVRPVTNQRIRSVEHEVYRSPSPVGTVTYRQGFRTQATSLDPER